MFDLTNEFEKTVIFFIIDIIAVFVFTWYWFKYIDKKRKQPMEESIKFTIAMQIYFFIYYFLFDSLWQYIYNSD